MEVIYGSACCDNCEKAFDRVVFLYTGFESVALCIDCIDEVFQKAKIVAKLITEEN